MKNFEKKLMGGHSSSLGITIEVVEEVSDNQELFDKLFNHYFVWTRLSDYGCLTS